MPGGTNQGSPGKRRQEPERRGEGVKELAHRMWVLARPSTWGRLAGGSGSPGESRCISCCGLEPERRIPPVGGTAVFSLKALNRLEEAPTGRVICFPQSLIYVN